MFKNIPEMFIYIEKLQEIHKQSVEKRKEELDYKCEACNVNPIEIDYKCNDYSHEQYTENGVKLTINAHYFCKSCYIKIINTEQLPKSIWMEEIDKEIFGEKELSV